MSKSVTQHSRQHVLDIPKQTRLRKRGGGGLAQLKG
jgi:hypothetical protein